MYIILKGNIKEIKSKSRKLFENGPHPTVTSRDLRKNKISIHIVFLAESWSSYC